MFDCIPRIRAGAPRVFKRVVHTPGTRRIALPAARGGGGQRRNPRAYSVEEAIRPEASALTLGWKMQQSARTIGVAVLIAGVVLAAVLAYSYRPGTSASSNPNAIPQPGNTPQCQGTAACFTNTVAYVVDGDTLDVGTTRIRLALVNSPEVGQPGYSKAKNFTAQTCPVESQALVDEDDGQTGGSYGRMVALVYCGGVNLNAALLDSGNAVLVPYYCSMSEFANESWTGC